MSFPHFNAFIRSAIFLFLTFFLLPGCNSKNEIIAASFIRLGDKGLIQGKKYILFPFENSLDSTLLEPCEISLVIRYDNMFVLKDLLLDIESSSTDSISSKNFPVCLNLFNDNDEPCGKGNYGIYEIKKNLFSGIMPFKKFHIIFSSPQKNTQGIREIGIVCEK